MGTRPVSSASPDLSAHVRTTALFAANPYTVRRHYSRDWAAWKRDYFSRLGEGTSWLEVGGTNVGIYGLIRASDPVLSGISVGPPLLSFVLRSIVLSGVISGVMTGYQVGVYGTAPGMSAQDQFALGWVQSIPSMMLGMGAGKLFRKFTRYLTFDLATEVVQGAVGAGMTYGLEETGKIRRSDLKGWQRFMREVGEGGLYWSSARITGGLMHGVERPVDLKDPKENPPIPELIGSRVRVSYEEWARTSAERLDRAWAEHPTEVGGPGGSKGRGKERTPRERAAQQLVKILKANRSRGLTRDKVPFASAIPLKVVEVVDGDTFKAIAEGQMDEAASVRMIGGNAPEAEAGSSHPEAKCARGELGAVEAYWVLSDLFGMHQRVAYLRHFRLDAFSRPTVHPFVRTRRGIWLDLERAMIESGSHMLSIIAPDVTGKRAIYGDLQEAAQEARRGIWQYPTYQTEIHISVVRVLSNDPGAHPHLTYMRLVNLSRRRINLAGYEVRNGPLHAILPSFPLDPGFSVKVLFCGDAYNANMNRELVVSARHLGGVADPAHPLLDLHHAFKLTDPQGRLVSARGESRAVRETLPSQFSHKRVRGLHVMAFNPLRNVVGFGDERENFRILNHDDAPAEIGGYFIANGRQRIEIPHGTTLPPHRAVQVFTCRGKTEFEPTHDIELYLGITSVRERLLRNDRPLVLLSPRGDPISMEASMEEARRRVPREFWQRKGAGI